MSVGTICGPRGCLPLIAPDSVCLALRGMAWRGVAWRGVAWRGVAVRNRADLPWGGCAAPCCRGNVYTGHWKNNVRHGQGTMQWHDRREIYTGEWKDGVQVRFEFVNGRGLTACMASSAKQFAPVPAPVFARDRRSHIHRMAWVSTFGTKSGWLAPRCVTAIYLGIIVHIEYLSPSPSPAYAVVLYCAFAHSHLCR